jgi:hypothetical protein
VHLLNLLNLLDLLDLLNLLDLLDLLDLLGFQYLQSNQATELQPSLHLHCFAEKFLPRLPKQFLLKNE